MHVTTHIWEAEEEESRLDGDALEECAAAVGRARRAADHVGRFYLVNLKKCGSSFANVIAQFAP